MGMEAIIARGRLVGQACNLMILDEGNKVALLDRRACIPAIGFLLSISTSSLLAAPLPREGCRAVSKIEYSSAKRQYLLISRYRKYVRTGHFWRHYYWQCPR
jgi:hypothetical protein